VEDLRRKRQQLSAFLLRQGRHYPGGRAWTKSHRNWLASQKLDYAEQRIAFEEMLLAMRQAQERIERLEQAIRLAVPDWSLAEVVTALMALRGIDFISATAFLAEIGDLSRFRTPRELMGYLGLVPSEASTGDTVRRGPITKESTKGILHVSLNDDLRGRCRPHDGDFRICAARAVRHSPRGQGHARQGSRRRKGGPRHRAGDVQ
jgi:transposase